MLKRFFQALVKGKPTQIPGVDALQDGHAKGVNLGDPAAGGTRVILCRVEGHLHAIDSLCPHEGGRLQHGPLAQGKYAICPLHNFLFDPTDGKVVRGSCAKAKVYKVEEKDGEATLWT